MHSYLNKLRLFMSVSALFTGLLFGNPLAFSAEEDSEPMMENIVVTGSRIKRNEFNSAAPIQVITTERSALAGLLSTTDILQGSTVASGQQIDDSFSGFVTDGGPGANSISLRGLGGQRSLVLVNGKRWSPSGVRGSISTVDLTAVPTSLVSRYEILKDGASSIYGADAVAGVVNAITRTSIDGASIGLSVAAPEIGAGQEYELHGVYGHVGDNWYINVGATITQQEEVVRSDLDYGRCEIRPRLTDQFGDGYIDNYHPETGEPLCFGLIYGLLSVPRLGFARYEPSLSDPTDTSNPFYDPTLNGAWGLPYYTRVPATPLDNSGAYLRDTRSRDIAHVQTENLSYSMTSTGALDFALWGRSATAYYELYFNHRETRANSGYSQYFPDVPATNPFNPFGAAGPWGDGRGVTPVLMNYELVDRNSDVEIDRINFFIGLKGDLTETWTYDAYLGAGHSDGEYRSHSFLDGQVAASNDVVLDASGNPRCSDKALAAYPDCVPANLFTEDALLYGRLPADLLQFITKRTTGTTEYQGLQFSAYATGEIFPGPAGTASLGAGLEVRYESIDDQPDIEAQMNNIFNFTSAGITKGSDTVAELFAELEVPLLSGEPLAEELVVNVSGRFTDYRSYGSDFTWRVTANWQIVPTLRVRGTAGTSFRAPALYEQFLGDQTGFGGLLNDPCVGVFDDTSDLGPGDTVYDNCVSQGLPMDFPGDGGSGYVIVTGGASTLMAETSDSWTLGVVLQPEEFGLSLGITAFDISIEDTVTSLSSVTILGACYTSVGLSSPFCSRIADRDAQGFLTTVDASFINVGLQATTGADFDFLYEHEFNSFDFEVDGTFTYISEFYTEVLGETTSHAGRFSFPRWQGEVDFLVDYRDWRFYWRIDWIGSTDEGEVYDPGTTNVDRVTSTDHEFYHTVSAEYRLDPWTAIFTIRNLMDEDPPIVADGSGTVSAARIFNTIPGSGYPLLGRTFTFQLAYEF